MLLLGDKLINCPIMGIQTGTRLGLTGTPIIDPSNLKITAFEIHGPNIKDRLYLRTADIREFSKIGMIIDSNDEFIKSDDVIVIKKIIDLNFGLAGIKVIDDNKKYLGKVKNFVVEINSFVIQQLVVQSSLVRRINLPEIRVHRSQILEVNDNFIIVKSGLEKQPKVSESAMPNLDFINPFRQKTSQPEAQKQFN